MEELKNFRKSLNLTETGARKPSREFIAKLKQKFPQFDVNIFFLQS